MHRATTSLSSFFPASASTLRTSAVLPALHAILHASSQQDRRRNASTCICQGKALLLVMPMKSPNGLCRGMHALVVRTNMLLSKPCEGVNAKMPALLSCRVPSREYGECSKLRVPKNTKACQTLLLLKSRSCKARVWLRLRGLPANEGSACCG